MDTVTISGRFLDEQRKPIEGRIKFVPSKLWVDHGEHTYPCLAPEQELVNGWFSVEVTPTDSGPYPWRYTVVSPVGIWSVKVVSDEGNLLLRDLLPKRFA